MTQTAAGHKSRNRGDWILYICSSILLIFIAFLVYLYYDSNDAPDNFNKITLESVLDKYEKIKATPLSDDLYPELHRMVIERKECFSSKAVFDERKKICRKAYIQNIFNTARHSIKSAPMPGLFIRCIRECPISGSLCSGEAHTSEGECVDMEVRCVEFCMDWFWRGGSFPDENDFTYQRNRD